MVFGIVAAPLLEGLYLLDATDTGVGGDVLRECGVGLGVEVGGAIENLRNGIP